MITGKDLSESFVAVFCKQQRYYADFMLTCISYFSYCYDQIYDMKLLKDLFWFTVQVIDLLQQKGMHDCLYLSRSEIKEMGMVALNWLFSLSPFYSGILDYGMVTISPGQVTTFLFILSGDTLKIIPKVCLTNAIGIS